MTGQQTPLERATFALTNSGAFCALLAQAREYKAPGWWEGSAFRSHPCGLVVDTIKFTNFWHVDGLCSIEITDGLGWDVDKVCKDSFSHCSAHPKPIEGDEMTVWRCGQWSDPSYGEALQPRVLEILVTAAAHIAAAIKARDAGQADRLAAEHAARREKVKVALAKAAGGGA